MEKQVIKLSAEWCGPCKAYAPTFMSLMDEMEDSGWDVIFSDIDTDEGKEIAQKYGIRGVPATVIIKDGDHKVSMGSLTEQQLRTELDM